MNTLYVPWWGALVYLLLTARMGLAITLVGTVSQIGPAGQFVYQTGSPNGLVRVYYSPYMEGSEIIRNQFVAVDGDFDQDSNFMASALRVLVSGMPDALDYYVSPDGSDDRDGSADDPWQTISHAASALTLGQFGTVVHVAPGTYAGEHGGAGVQIASSGTASARIRFISDGQWQAQVSGQSYGIYTNASYVDIVGFDVSAPTGSAGIDMGPNPPVAGSGIGMYVFGNDVHDIGDGDTVCHSGGGISSSSGDGLGLPQAQGIITGNVVNRVGNLALTTCNQTHGIYVSNGWTVENNIVSQCRGIWSPFLRFWMRHHRHQQHCVQQRMGRRDCERADIPGLRRTDNHQQQHHCQ